jgi:hypothetical protein
MARLTIAPLAAALAAGLTFAGAGVTAATAAEIPGMVQPASANVVVTLGDKLVQKIEEEHLGMRDVQEQIDRLTAEVSEAMAANPALAGGQARLTLTDLSPNRPTFEQLSHSPGLDPFRSVSIGGAAFEGEITTANGRSIPVDFDWYSPSITDAAHASTWQDATRAFERFARRVSRDQPLS